MDNKEKLSGSEDKDENGVKPEVVPSINAAKSGAHAHQEVKTKKRKGIRKKSIRPERWVGLIPAIATIIGAMLGFPPLIQWLQASPTPTFISTSSPTSFITDTPTFLFTDTPTFAVSPSITSTFTIMPTDIPASATPAAQMEVYLYANKTTRRAPLKIKLDARDSYLREPNGEQFPCRGGACEYAWRVYSNGQQMGKSENNSSGTFEYSFGKNGAYLVTVWVCRGRDKIDCGGSGVQIVVTR